MNEVLSSKPQPFVNLQHRLIERFCPDADRRFFETERFAWVGEIESAWRIIRRDLDAALAEPERIPDWASLSERQSVFAGTRWKTFMFYFYGRRVEENCERFPQTAALLRRIPGMNLAMFSILDGNARIPTHQGPYKGVLRYHLGLKVPVENETCALRVDNEVRCWKEGKSLIFDDTFEHEVWNLDPRPRVVLFVDFFRPLPGWLAVLNRGIAAAAVHSHTVKEAQETASRYARGRGTEKS
ncbi:aspartyl/asparaginyl beta-hydroxylase domain-containing protein [Gloeobacter morelensis]|uniref:Aspartyl/asparaginyl beta-hydroxylase domain-containing protein n=1 Tax=Gloeobacter morelensis MG652769 TaxID=2781736 RepID=A0ABY3PT35_9CYAN|nr:aspartyl/asparaginyl beta-hydroxylase domain-containing protein [Gloeobacter morelensis]UFP96639.1 aspartyl/asparaginyl beta-hydroxylase domain-containing protein [Gloeobacter morelensis MG652769]